jgi:hypothetical protein
MDRHQTDAAEYGVGRQNAEDPARKKPETKSEDDRPRVRPAGKTMCEAFKPPARDSEVASFFHFNTLLGPIGLEDHVDSLNDFFALIGLTIDDEFVLEGFGAVNLHHMLLAKTVVPTTIPGRQIISVFLKRVGQLGAG